MKKILLAIVAVMLVANMAQALTTEEIGDVLDKAKVIAAKIESPLTGEMAIKAVDQEIADARSLWSGSKINTKDYYNTRDRAELVRSVLLERVKQLREGNKR
jgi:hypothetical protein